MAAYPSYGIKMESQRMPENTFRDDLSSSGVLHSRTMHSKQYYIFEIVHPGLTGQQYADLFSSYTGDPRGTWTGLSWHTSSPSETYSVIFIEPPRVIRNHGNNRFDVAVKLRGWAA